VLRPAVARDGMIAPASTINHKKQSPSRLHQMVDELAVQIRYRNEDGVSPPLPMRPSDDYLDLSVSVQICPAPRIAHDNIAVDFPAFLGILA
jgi:hypothetical protein